MTAGRTGTPTATGTAPPTAGRAPGRLGGHSSATVRKDDGNLAGRMLTLTKTAGNRHIRFAHQPERLEALPTVQTNIFIDRHKEIPREI